jgi:hypothetical protein
MNLTRATEVADYTGRTLEGYAYRYERPSRVTDDGWQSSYYEEMLKGSDVKTLRERAVFPVHKQHESQRYGEVTFHHSDDERALMFRATIDHGPDGDALLADLDNWMDVSVSFDALRNSYREAPNLGKVIQRAEIRLDELSLAATGTGLVKGAEVTHVRAATTPRLTALRKRLILL